MGADFNTGGKCVNRKENMDSSKIIAFYLCINTN
jgi:hypothetical protein